MSAVGKTVIKTFVEGVFTGEIVKFFDAADTTGNESLWEVRFSDGDHEDFTYSMLEAVLTPQSVGHIVAEYAERGPPQDKASASGDAQRASVVGEVTNTLLDDACSFLISSYDLNVMSQGDLLSASIYNSCKQCSNVFTSRGAYASHFVPGRCKPAEATEPGAEQAAMATANPQLQQALAARPRSAMGKAVIKTFVEGVFTGEIVNFFEAAETMEKERLWEVKFSDGDHEDFTYSKLEAVL